MKGKVIRCTSQGGSYVVIGQRGKKRYRFTGTSHERKVITTEFTSEVFAESEWREVRFDEVPHRMVKQVCKTLGIDTPKKVKLWYSAKEIAHIWANEAAPKGKTGGRMSFDGAGVYSYWTCIARIMHTKKGKRVYLLDSDSFSPTTGQHQSAVRQAIARDATILHISSGRRGQSLEFTPAELRELHVDQFNHQSEPRRMAYQNAAAVLARYHHLDEAIKVCEVFDLPTKELKALHRKGKAERDEARAVVKLRDDRLKAKRDERDAKARAERKQRAEASAASLLAGETFEFHETYPLDAPLKQQVTEKLAEINREKVNLWLGGANIHLPYDLPTMLRREEDEVVTSHGARVPVTAAERTYRFISKVKEKGWHSNGDKHTVGHYSLNEVKADEIVVGCHHIDWQEIERFAATQGWSQ